MALEDFRNWLYDTARTSGESVRELRADPINVMRQWGIRLGVDVTQQTRNALQNAQYGMSVMPQVREQATRNAIPAMMGAVTPLQTVWHGSPHLFDKFDISKIGTGEGSQFYGHGLYVAEHPNAARQYHTDLSDYAIKFGDSAINPTSRIEKEAADWLRSAIDARPSPKDPFDFASNKVVGVLGEDGKAIADQINKWKSSGATIDNNLMGGLYKVDLPDEHIAKMIDWDKPLSQQKEVLSKLKKSGYATADDASITGGEFYRKLVQELGADPADISADLLKSGIPGVKYLDANSRTTSFNPQTTGTRNYVVFDDKLLKILGRE